MPFLLLYLSVHALEISPNNIEKVLQNLDNEIENRDKYILSRQNQIDSLYILYQSSKDSNAILFHTLSIGDKYVAFNNDSALVFYKRGIDLASKTKNDSLEIVFKLKLLTNLPLAGFIDDAIREFEKIDTATISADLKDLYFESGKQMYSYIASFYSKYPKIYKKWNDKSLYFQSKLINSLNYNSIKYKLNQGEHFRSCQNYTKANAILYDIINTLDESSNLYARTAHTIATIAKANNDIDRYIYFLANSSISDIKSATLEVVSLQELSQILFERGDIPRAHKYSSTALANAVKCNALMRMAQSSEIMPIIEQVHTAEINNWHTKMQYLNVGIGALVISLIILLYYIYRKMKRVDTLRKNLKISNSIKEIYISQFLNLCSIYMDKLNQFSNIVSRKISTGKIEDLYKIAKSGKFIEEQSIEFFEVFDNAFLNIYPTFIKDVNTLLQPDQQISLKDDEKLNTDLRILALMRLGIEESTRISQILNYSVNTIYTYRNKLKNKAIDRDNFEKNIMNISSN